MTPNQPPCAHHEPFRAPPYQAARVSFKERKSESICKIANSISFKSTDDLQLSHAKKHQGELLAFYLKMTKEHTSWLWVWFVFMLLLWKLKQKSCFFFQMLQLHRNMCPNWCERDFMCFWGASSLSAKCTGNTFSSLNLPFYTPDDVF